MKTPLFVFLPLLLGQTFPLSGTAQDTPVQGQVDKLVMDFQTPADGTERKFDAAWHLALLGPAARKAIPALVNILVSATVHPKARMNALNAVGLIKIPFNAMSALTTATLCCVGNAGFGAMIDEVSAEPGDGTASETVARESSRIQQLNAIAQRLRGSNGSPTPVPFDVQRGDGQFDILFGGQRVATYLFKHPQLTRPAIVNVRTASGIPVTREFPAPENADHRWMHPGIAMGFGWLDGNDYWRFKAKVEQVSFLQEPVAEKERVTWAVRNRYLSEDGSKTVCVEESRYALGSDSAGLVLEIDSSFFNDERDFCFGDQEESGLCVRVAEPFRVKGGNGTILNDRGERNESGTWGREFQWIDYSGVSGNKRTGMLILPHTENARACWSHSRDYGVLVANPFPRQPQGRREPFVKTWVKKGERYRLRFSVLVYELASGQTIKIQGSEMKLSPGFLHR